MITIKKERQVLTYREKCPMCGCEFEYNVDDLEYDPDFYKYDSPPFRIGCPRCKWVFTYTNLSEITIVKNK